jgi:DNA-binding transcriptional regulator YiaG
MSKRELYHYTECGLDNVFLAGGYEHMDGGKTVIIHDIDGLQRAIGHALANARRRLTGAEFRFLRSELLLSQGSLGKMLDVKELTVGRWERGETEIPLLAEVAVRKMFLESVGQTGHFKKLLERLADLEDEIDRNRLTLQEKNGKWAVQETARAA